MEKRVVLGLMVVISLHVVNGEKTSSQILKETDAFLYKKGEFLTKLNDIAVSNPIAKFSGMMKFLAAWGPISMAFSAILTIFQLFMPGQETDEVKALNKGFEELNKNVDTISSQLGRLENTIELSDAKAALAAPLSNIKSNYEALNSARKSKDKKSYDYFVEKYNETFKVATNTIYDLMTGENGEFGFDIINLYKIRIRCNPTLLVDFCVKGVQYITRGMEIEGAYWGYFKFSDVVEQKAANWKSNLDALNRKCSELVKECEKDWQKYARVRFNDSYRELGGDNQASAQKLVKDLKTVVPQRSWMAVVYDAARGFNNHAIYALNKNDFETIWDSSIRCATIVSYPIQERLTESEYDKVSALIYKQKELLERFDDCKSILNNHKNEALYVVKIFREKYHAGVVYAIKMQFKPAAYADGGSLFYLTVKFKCNQMSFQIIVFQMN